MDNLSQLADSTILGIIQGLTEWLPVSSSGHLRLASHFLGVTPSFFFEIVLHVGTLLVLLFYFRSEVKSILSALARFDLKSQHGQLIPLMVIATVPTAVIGIVYLEYLEDKLQTTLPIALAFVVGGSLVYLSKYGRETKDKIDYRIALVVGVAQGLALFHGLSRSGLTISAALLLGLKRTEAFKFSFLLSIPAVVGALVFELVRQWSQISMLQADLTFLFVGLVATMIVGYASLRMLATVVATKKFHYFAFYTLPLGTALIAQTLVSL